MLARPKGMTRGSAPRNIWEVTIFGGAGTARRARHTRLPCLVLLPRSTPCYKSWIQRSNHSSLFPGTLQMFVSKDQYIKASAMAFKTYIPLGMHVANRLILSST